MNVEDVRARHIRDVVTGGGMWVSVNLHLMYAEDPVMVTRALESLRQRLPDGDARLRADYADDWLVLTMGVPTGPDVIDCLFCRGRHDAWDFTGRGCPDMEGT